MLFCFFLTARKYFLRNVIICVPHSASLTFTHLHLLLLLLLFLLEYAHKLSFSPVYHTATLYFALRAKIALAIWLTGSGWLSSVWGL